MVHFTTMRSKRWSNRPPLAKADVLIMKGNRVHVTILGRAQQISSRYLAGSRAPQGRQHSKLANAWEKWNWRAGFFSCKTFLQPMYSLLICILPWWYALLLFFQTFVYFKGRVTRVQKEEIDHPLVYSPNGHNNQGWTTLKKPGTASTPPTWELQAALTCMNCKATMPKGRDHLSQRISKRRADQFHGLQTLLQGPSGSDSQKKKFKLFFIPK